MIFEFNLNRMKPPIENIEQIRKAKKLTREDVANRLGVGLSNYGKMETGEIGITLERLYRLAEIFKMPAEEILSYRKAKPGNVTYVPIEAQAGFLSGYSQTQLSECKTYNLPFVEGKKLYMIDAVGDSMFPIIQHGDKIIVDQVMNLEEIKYGCIYLIVAKDGRVIKRIYTSSDNRKKVVLKSDNPIYEAYTIDKQDIISTWLVKDYIIRTNLVQNNPILPVELPQVTPRKKL